MKPCSLGLDDGFFEFEDKGIRSETALVGVVTNEIGEVLDVIVDLIKVDGLDGTARAIRIVEKAVNMYDSYLEVIFLDGVTYAGFNIVDPLKLNELLSIPIVVVFRHALDLQRIRSALKVHFTDWQYRYRIIERVYKRAFAVPSPVRGVNIRIAAIGIGAKRGSTLFLKYGSVYPEPYCLRAADRIASMLGRMIRDHVMMRIADADRES